MKTARRPARLAAEAAGIAAAVLAAPPAFAQSTIENPGDRGPSSVEAEAHVDLGTFDPPGFGTGFGYGIGGRVGIEVAHEGLLPSINDSIAINFGLDYLKYAGTGIAGAASRCSQYVVGPASTMVCSKAETPGSPSNYVFLPVTFEWNFWLSPKWSAFGEPGLAIYVVDGSSVGATPVLYGGGRYRITNNISLVLRIGYPSVSFGISFLF